MTTTEQAKPAGPGPLKAAAKLAAVTEEYNKELFGAKENGKLVVWVTSMAFLRLKGFCIVTG